MRLPPGDQRKGQGVVAEAEEREGADGLAALGRGDADQRSARPEQRSGEAHAQGYQCQRRQLSDGDADEEKRPAPQQRQQSQETPFARVIARCATAMDASPSYLAGRRGTIAIGVKV